MLFEAAPIGIVRVDRDGRLEANRAMERMVGYTAEELAATSFREYTHPDDVEQSAVESVQAQVVRTVEATNNVAGEWGTPLAAAA